ncbi:MAG: non-ribosomal peptide synthetase, partial [bacterium]|nr:non-ribosomal peptide synthetase [bacterium]
MRWLPDGTIEFLGRFDFQVKVRGFRIEPGEIENQLLSHEKILETVVVTRESNTGENDLCAYYVPKANLKEPGQSPQPHELWEFLSQKLPPYMVPAYYVPIEAIPLNANGKVDLKALEAIDIQELKTQKGYTAPRNEREKKLAAIWTGILEMEENTVGIDDNFFRLGGHSLKAMILVSRIHKILEVKIPIAGIFNHPTIRAMAEYIGGAVKKRVIEIEKVETREYYPLSSAQMRVYLLYQMAPESLNYNMYQALPVKNRLEKTKVEGIFRDLISRHESLRTSFLLKDGKPVQKIADVEEINFDVAEFGKAKEEEIVTSFEESLRPFDLAEPPLIRVGIAETTAGKNMLLCDMHHIISYGMSVEILEREYRALYNGEALPELGLRYRDFA